MGNQAYDGLKQYILRKLGSPVINIEITDDQLEDCIDESIELFYEEHFNGVHVGYLPLALISGTIEYQLEDEIQEVLRIVTSDNLSFDWSGGDSLLMSSFYLGNEQYPISRNTLVDVEVYRQTVKMYANYFDVPIQFDYNALTRKLFLYVEPKENINTFLKVYKSDDGDIKKYLKDSWVKAYSTALARLQWGDNLSKYTGVNLPGGAEFNSSGIIDRAESDLERLREELEDKFSLPLDPQVG